MIKPSIAVAVCACAASFALVAATTERTDAITHVVKKGETVSLLCIKFYGYYSAELGQEFLRRNPAVKDVNVILAGQVLSFGKPREAGSVPDDAPAEVQLLEQRVAITQGVVTYVEGQATLVPKSTGKRGPLQANALVYPGDLIETGVNGRVEVIVNRESVMRLKENSRLILGSFRDAENQKGKTRAGFSAGSVWAKVRKFKDRISRFELQLPTAIAGVHGTVYEATVAADSSADVRVFNGEVSVKNAPRGQTGEAGGLSEVSGPDEVPGPSEVSMEQWTRIVRDMQRLHIDRTGKPSAPQAFARNAKDSWEKWNEERDRWVAEMFGEAN